ncbi:ester cyclase [Amycolatopsis sp. cmx-11-51]|uniref:ester cyclase n=1 Tax=unclassified Amycolatopsis TaxID=2618356 RepID=UPI0039E28F97
MSATSHTENDQQPDESALQELQGRWFESAGGLTNGAGTTNGRPVSDVATAEREEPKDLGLALRENLSLITRLPTPAREQLFDQFLATVSGQINGTITVSQSPVSQDLRQRNIDIFYKYIEYENSRNYEGMENLFHPTEFRSKTYFGNDPISPKAHTRMLLGLFRSFPDWFMVINEIVSADNEAVVGLITGRGTQFEEFAGRPPKDHQIAIPTLHAIKVRDGLIVEHRHINPFEDIFANQIMAPLTEDIMAVRAQQGFDSSMAQRAYEAAVAAGADPQKLTELKTLIEVKRRQCQVLLKGTLRRCAMIAPPGEIYCEHHQEHGYGIDGLE